MKKLSLLYFLIFVIMLIDKGCDSGTDSPAFPMIKYTVSGGYFSGVHTKLIIDQYGNVFLESENPVLKQRLTSSEYYSLLGLFENFNDLSNTYYGTCVDIPIYTIEYRRGRSIKTVAADGSLLFDQRLILAPSSDIERLKVIIDKLNEIVQRIRGDKQNKLD